MVHAFEKQREVNARRQRNSVLMRVHFGLAAAGLALLAEAVLVQNSRGALIFFILLGAPLLLAQLVCGLVPELFGVTRQLLTGGERLRLLVAAIVGPLATVSACVFCWLTGSMC